MPTTNQRPKVTRQFAGRGYDGGKPCPTCYAQMTLEGKAVWMCAKHGAPSRP